MIVLKDISDAVKVKEDSRLFGREKHKKIREKTAVVKEMGRSGREREVSELRIGHW